MGSHLEGNQSVGGQRFSCVRKVSLVPVFTSLLAAFFAVACARGGGGSGSAPPTPLADGTPPAAQLAGEWRSNCADSKLWGITQSTELRLMGREITIIDRMSKDGRCSGNLIEVTYRGTYAESAPGANVGTGTAGIDLQPMSVTVKPLTEEGARLLKIMNWCRKSDWTAGAEQDVTEQTVNVSRSSSEIESRCFSKIPSTYYQAYVVEGGNLYLTRDAGAKSPEKRPFQVDKDVFFARP